MMLENGLWNATLTYQDSSCVATTTCWNCGGKVYKSGGGSYKKVTHQETHLRQNQD